MTHIQVQNYKNHVSYIEHCHTGSEIQLDKHWY